MNGNTPSFYAIIPACVRYDKRLSAEAKILYGEISALTNKEGYCWATNGYFRDLYEWSQSSLTRYLKQLTDAGHIRVVVDQGAGNERRIYLSSSLPVIEAAAAPPAPLSPKPVRPIVKSEQTPIFSPEHHNNTSKNSLINRNTDSQESAFELEVIGEFKKAFPQLPALRDPKKSALGEKIIRAIPARAKSQKWQAGDLTPWKALFESLAKSDFISVEIQNGRRWFSLEWLLKPLNFEKAIQGNYSGKQAGLPPRRPGGQPEKPRNNWTPAELERFEGNR